MCVPGTLALMGGGVFLLSFVATFLLPGDSSVEKAAALMPFEAAEETLRDVKFYMVWVVFALSVVGGLFCCVIKQRIGSSCDPETGVFLQRWPGSAEFRQTAIFLWVRGSAYYSFGRSRSIRQLPSEHSLWLPDKYCHQPCIPAIQVLLQ